MASRCPLVAQSLLLTVDEVPLVAIRVKFLALYAILAGNAVVAGILSTHGFI